MILSVRDKHGCGCLLSPESKSQGPQQHADFGHTCKQGFPVSMLLLPGWVGDVREPIQTLSHRLLPYVHLVHPRQEMVQVQAPIIFFWVSPQDYFFSAVVQCILQPHPLRVQGRHELRAGEQEVSIRKCGTHRQRFEYPRVVEMCKNPG